MAWAPPMRYTSSTPAMAAAASVASGGMPVVRSGGTASTTSGTPATRAGTRRHEHGRRVDGPAARHVAAGPVDRDRRATRPRMPSRSNVGRRVDLGAVVGLDGVRRLPRARARRSAGIAAPGRRRSASGGTRRSSSSTPSKRAVSSRTATSPLSRTAARMARTAATGSSPSSAGRGRRAAHVGPAPRRSSRVSIAPARLPAAPVTRPAGLPMASGPTPGRSWRSAAHAG